MSNLAIPSISFYDWIKAIPCYYRNERQMLKSDDLHHFYDAFAKPSQVCEFCAGCGSLFELWLEPPWSKK